jgi:phosphonatase-like hydrolase
MNTIEMAIFDMAGTTVDEDLVVYKTLYQILRRRNYEFNFEEVMYISAGKEKKMAIDELFDGIEVDELVKKSIYDEFSKELNQLYQNMIVKEQKGASEIFAYLRNKNIKVILNTGYDRLTAEKLLESLGWKIGETIDDLITSDDVKRGRPNPDMILLAQRKHGIQNPFMIAKIGDTTYDVEEGIYAGCIYNFAVLTGAHSMEILEKAMPYAILNDLTELKNYF